MAVRRIGRRSRVLVALLCFGLVGAMFSGGCGDRLGDARALEDQGDWAGAVSLYEDMLEGNPDELGALEGAAIALYMMGRYDEALPYQERVAEVDPTDVQIRIDLGFNYLNHQDRAEDAVDVFAEAATIEPNGRVFTYLGQASRVAGDLEGAEKAFRDAIGADPTYGYAYSQLVTLLEGQGRTEEAALLVELARAQGIEVNSDG